MEFVKYIHKFEVYKDWRIENGLMNDRGYKVGESDFFMEMRNTFRSKDMFYKKVSIAEMTTWLDSFIHLERLCKLMIANFNIDKLNEIEIGFEYVVKMSKKSRVDAIIKYRGKYCIFEFSTVSSFNKLKPTFDKKRLELMIYKDMMHNYIEYPSKIICYPFIGLFEYNDEERNEKYFNNNIKNISYAYDYLKNFLLTD
jgi:hypothetical protein